MFEEVFESLICVEGRAEACELAHSPELSAIPRCVNTARVRRLTRKAEFGFVIEIRQARGRVEPLYGGERCGSESLFAFGHSLERRIERALFPFALGFLQFITGFNSAHRLSPQIRS